jgi:hypothetical protein
LSGVKLYIVLVLGTVLALGAVAERSLLASPQAIGFQF